MGANIIQNILVFEHYKDTLFSVFMITFYLLN